MLQVGKLLSMGESTTMSTDTVPPEAAPAAWTPPPPPPPPARKGGLSKGTGLAIAVIVIIVLVILALLLTGVIPGFKSSSSGGSTPSGKSYNVTFSETGLPSGKSWSVTLSGSTLSSTTGSIVFSEKNGTYTFTVGAVTGFAANPATGSLTVAGAAVAKSIAFSTGYTVTFTESGLPSGTTWSVTLNSVLGSSSTASVVFTEANGTYTYTIGSVSGYTPSPSTGSVNVSGASQSVPITFSPLTPGTYQVTFTESGLTSGTSWSVTLNGTATPSTTTTVVFSEKNGTYAYSVAAVAGYTAAPTSGNVTVAGSAMSVTITFTKSSGFGGPAYAVTFDQTGLPTTFLWGADCVPLTGTTVYFFGELNSGPSTEFAIPDGTYFCHVGSENNSYQAVPSSLNVTVAGSPVTVHVQFLLQYTVTFNETGLASSAPWTVTLNGSEGFGTGSGNVTFQVVNGTYPFTVSAFGYTAVPASGSITVSGANVTKVITFTALPTYTVTFTESGLMAGLSGWDVNLNGSFGVATAPSSIVFAVPNGVYSFSVYASGFTASPENGSITVASHAVTQAISFTAIPTYAVTFTESGLALGTFWGAEISGSSSFNTAPGSIVIQAPNGVDFFTVGATGYTASPASGNVTVASAPKTVMITFTATAPVTMYNVTFNETGLPSPSDDWEVDMESNGGFFSLSCSNASLAGVAQNCSVPNGYYSWVVYTSTPNYTASPMGGYITIHGAGATVNVTYVNSSAEYLVLFYEAYLSNGFLPNGTSWSVTVGGDTVTTEGMWVYFLEPNGSAQTYTITPPAGYVVLPSSGSVTGYANPSQASEFAIGLTPYVLIVFIPTSGSPAHAAAVGATFTAYLVAVPRDS
jgi:hypothetical protein